MPKKEVKKAESEDESGSEASSGSGVEVDPEKFMAQLQPEVRRRVYGLKGVQKEWDVVHAEYVKEMTALETKYENLYLPLFEARQKIVTGEKEPTDAEVEGGAKIVEITEEGEEKPAGGTVGIPDFWLKAMKNNEAIEEIITDRDEPALSHLTDIVALNMEDPNKGFMLHFHFKENPYFTDEVLTKTYHLVDDGEILLDKAEGCQINWKPNKNLTQIQTKKKQRHKGGGGKVRTVTKTEPCESFFNFFDPPQLNSDDDEDDEDEDEEVLLEHDYDVGRNLKDKVIPKAVDWFTGKESDADTAGIQIMMGGGGSDDDDDAIAATLGGGGGGGGGDPTNPPECKQQ